MEQNGGCCIARYAGGAYDMSRVDRLMMRFRPIAPKPASPNFHGGAAVTEKIEPSVKSTGRGKRRNAGHKPYGGGRKRKSSSPEGSASGGETEVKTLSFLPEAPGVKESNPKGGSKQTFPQWLSFGTGNGSTVMGHVRCEKPVVVGSFVKVECVIDTWVVDGCGWYGAVARTDEDRVMGLDLDTCPGFVTDGLNRVIWTNAAYKRMVGGEAEVAVVVEKGVVLPVGIAGFTCRVRVGTCGREKGCKTVPCDVWRMDCGGFAWRLDTTAALSLGW